MEISSSIIDHYEFLSQDGCDKPLRTKEHVWPTKIRIWSHAHEGFPKPPTDEPKFDRQVLSSKVVVVSKTTKLGVHNVYGWDKDKRPFTKQEPNEWVVVYGRTFISQHLTTKMCEGRGCGGCMGAPVVIVVDLKNIHVVNSDGTVQPAEKE